MKAIVKILDTKLTKKVQSVPATTQCDHIWRNFATLTNYKSICHFWVSVNFGFYSKFLTYFGNILYHWAHFHWPNIVHIIQPSDHTGVRTTYSHFHSDGSTGKWVTGNDCRASMKVGCSKLKVFCKFCGGQRSKKSVLKLPINWEENGADWQNNTHLVQHQLRYLLCLRFV